jgi:hypothetical protein
MPNPTVTIETNHGTIVAEMFADRTLPSALITGPPFSVCRTADEPPAGRIST